MKNFIIAASIVACSAAAQAQAPETVMERAVRGYTNMTSMRADFRQTITNPLTASNNVR